MVDVVYLDFRKAFYLIQGGDRWFGQVDCKVGRKLSGLLCSECWYKFQLVASNVPQMLETVASTV